MPEYDAATRQRAAAEVEALGEGSVIANILLPDYGKLRDEARICRGARVPNRKGAAK